MRLRIVLVRDDQERARLLDMGRRVRRSELIATTGMVVAIALCVPSLGPQILAPPLCAVAAFVAAQTRLPYVRRPEVLLAGAFVFTQAMNAVAVLVASGPSLYLLALFMFPVLLVSAVFPARAAAAGVLFTALLMIATAMIANPSMLSAAPFALIYPAAAMIAAAVPAAAVRELDVKTRASVVVDQLTGVLNRSALESRVAELEHQSSVADRHVTLLLGDVDHFKVINDYHGHGVGDAVLHAVAQQLAETIGTAYPVYRLGGEEFVLLLPDHEAESGVTLADQLRRAVSQLRVGEVKPTISFGVASSVAGEHFDYRATFSAADQALYQAKRAGRNRVHVAHAVQRQDRATAAGTGAWVLALERRHEHSTRTAERTSAQIALKRREVRLAEEHAQTGSWLARDDVERGHILELNRRLHASNRPGYLVGFAAIVAGAFVYGWICVVPPALAAVIYNVVEGRLDRMRRPEYVLGGMWLLMQTFNATGIAFVHFSSPRPPFFCACFLSIMFVGSSAVFPRRGVLVGVGFGLVLTMFATTAIDPWLALHNPGFVALPVALVGAAGLIGSAAGRSALDHRDAAVVDRLTGMLNRSALLARVSELAHHATATGQEVSVIVADLDHFKMVNDTHGHTVGDKVLQETAHRLCGCLRAFDAAYRVGGEEFVILLPGVSGEEALTLAERVRAAVGEDPVAGLKVTLSLGVSGTEPGEPFEYQRIFRRADAALYQAKQTGRNRVCRVEPQAERALAA
jgi:diguanylate cyclase (GGDEF)-like protein